MTKPVTPQDMFELWQRMVNPGAYPLQSLMFPVLDPKELEKKIAELQVVEHWLKANVNMVQMTVKSLQFQLAMLKGGEKGLEAYAQAAGSAAASGRDASGRDASGGDGSAGDSGAGAAGGTQPGMPPNPALWMWNLMADATRPPAPSPSSAKPKAASRKPRRRKAG